MPEPETAAETGTAAAVAEAGVGTGAARPPVGRARPLAAPSALRLPDGFPDAKASTTQRTLLDAVITAAIPDPPCVGRLALPRLDRWTLGAVEALVEVGRDVSFRAGVVFGGYLTCLADLFAGFAVMTVLPDGHGFLTIDLNTTFHLPVTPGQLQVESTVDDLSRRRAVVSVRMRQDGRLAASAMATQMIVRGPQSAALSPLLSDQVAD